MGARLQQSAWKIMTFIDIAVNLKFVFAVSQVWCDPYWFVVKGHNDSNPQGWMNFAQGRNEALLMVKKVVTQLSLCCQRTTDYWKQFMPLWPGDPGAIQTVDHCYILWAVLTYEICLPFRNLYLSHTNLSGTSLDPGYTESPLHYVEYGEAGEGRGGGFSWEQNKWILELGDLLSKWKRNYVLTFSSFPCLCRIFKCSRICAAGVYLLDKCVVLHVLSQSVLCFTYSYDLRCFLSVWPYVNDS